jgi:hypothetical protein
MIIKNFDDKGFSPTLQQTVEEISTIYYSRKSKRNRKRYKRNLKRIQRSYFKYITEEKKYNTDEFYDQLYEWEMI